MSIDELGKAAVSDLTRTTSNTVQPEQMLAQMRNERARRTKLVRTASAVAAVMILVVGGGFAASRWPNNDQPVPPVNSYPDNGKIIVVGTNYSLNEVEPDGPVAHEFQSSGSGGATFHEYTWSPDGSQMAFLYGFQSGQFDPGDMSLYVINADGSDMRRLAHCPDHGTCGLSRGSAGISWSPDGTQIALTADGALYVLQVDTGSKQQVPVGDASVRAAAWSPDGTHIAFAQEGSLFVVSPDGSEITELAGIPKASEVDWSPDGARIAVTGPHGIYVLNADGSNLQQFATPGGGAPATWSPDSTRIAYSSTPKEASGYVAEIWSLDPQSGNTTRLYQSECCISDWGGPEWSPDGRYIAFSLDLVSPALFIMNSDGTDVRRQIGTGPIFEPEWQPIP